MTIETYSFQRGEPIALGDLIESGAAAGFTMRARMKPEDPRNKGIMPATEPAIGGFASTFVAGGGPDGADAWLHAKPAAESLALAAGDYLFDSSLLDAGGAVVWTSEPVRLALRNAASAAP